MIHIIDNYYLSADGVCYKLGVRRDRKDGREELERITYHHTILEALNAAIRRALNDHVASGEIESIQSAITELGRIKAEIVASVQGLNTELFPQDALRIKSERDCGSSPEKEH